MTRNLGGSIGIALLGTAVEAREHFHFSVLAERLTRNSVHVADRLAALAHRLGDEQRAVAALANQVRRQALVMAYADGFMLMGWGLLLVLLAVPFLVPAPKGGGGGGH